MNRVKDIREQFGAKRFANPIQKAGTLELVNASFIADEPSIFGTVNEDYVRREIDWYMSMSRNVNDIEPPIPEIWKRVAAKDGFINSNYGWCVFSTENGNQFDRVVEALEDDNSTRQAVMIYTRPSMHEDSKRNGMYDFMCTNTVQYMFRGNKLIAIVNMRSNDAVYGYKNDYAWQRHVLDMLAEEFSVPEEDTMIYWNAGSLHIYDRHFNLVDQYLEEFQAKVDVKRSVVPMRTKKKAA